MSNGQERLDVLLELSSPPTNEITPEIEAEIRRLRADVRSRTDRASRRRRLGPLVAGLAGALVLGSAATGAVAAGIWSNPWAADPVASFTFTLPSGAVCEQRIGDVRGLDEEGRAAVESVYRKLDLAALVSPANISAAIVERRSHGPGVFVHDDGSTEDAGYGTDRYNEDEEYWTAVWDVVTTAFDREAARAGIDVVGTDLSFSGEANCPGADW